jgi:phosphoglycolate phosphatase
MVKHVIWDWNGTLLNDVDVCLSSMNELLSRYALDGIDLERYRQIFDFPVKAYYQTAGFDFLVHDWDEVATTFMDLYWQNVSAAALFEDSISLIEQLKASGVQMHVLSAMQHPDLVRMLQEHSILHLFSSVWGTGDHYGSGKTEVGRMMVQSIPDLHQNALMIGDTTHDAEVAISMGVEPVLVAFGHQSEERLRLKSNHVARSFSELHSIIIGE